MISIIIPLYNKSACIIETVNSILSQNYSDFEIVIVNDGSTDDSVSKVNSIRDYRVRLILQENAGVSAARNKGIIASKGEWVLFLDADDRLLPGALEALIEPTLTDDTINVVVGNFYNVSSNQRILACNNKSAHFIANPYKYSFYSKIGLRAGSYIAKKEIQSQCLFDENLRRFEDLKMLMALCNISRIYSIPTPVMEYINDSKSLSGRVSDVSKDYTFNMEFAGKPFYAKCMLGILLFLSKFEYPDKQQMLRDKYGKYYFYGTIAIYFKRFYKILHLCF